jgi:hypothetical protein
MGRGCTQRWRDQAIRVRVKIQGATAMHDLLHFTPDLNAMPRHHLCCQITDAERQANHEQEREIYEQSCEREETNGENS